MKEYLLDSGEFNIIVRPEHRQYFILEEEPRSQQVLSCFLDGSEVPYDLLTPYWFKYLPDETWQDFEQRSSRLGTDLSEAALIENFVLKKFNFGSLVALRDTDTRKTKVFKRDKLRTVGREA